eukprot:362340-Chlamydomonas_euryale.AAC.5
MPFDAECMDGHADGAGHVRGNTRVIRHGACGQRRGHGCGQAGRQPAGSQGGGRGRDSGRAKHADDDAEEEAGSSAEMPTDVHEVLDDSAGGPGKEQGQEAVVQTYVRAFSFVESTWLIQVDSTWQRCTGPHSTRSVRRGGAGRVIRAGSRPSARWATIRTK